MLRIAFLMLLFATFALAHEPGIGPNGGMRVDAGPYRVELVPDGTRVNVYITMDDESSIDTTTMAGTAILLIDGKALRAPLAPASPRVSVSGHRRECSGRCAKGAVQNLGQGWEDGSAKF